MSKSKSLAILSILALLILLALAGAGCAAWWRMSRPEPVPYRRSLYVHWIDADKDCQDTREEVLDRSNLAGRSRNCEIQRGRWEDPWTGRVFFHSDSLQIDHLVALAEAHRSGAWAWSARKRREFANDLSTPGALAALHGPLNQEKSDHDPARWLPPDSSRHRTYARTWVAVKRRWKLAVDSAEWRVLERILAADPDELRELRKLERAEEFPVGRP